MASVRYQFARLALLGVTLTGALAGCKAGPDYTPPPAPASRALAQGAFLRGPETGEAQTPVARWWEGLGDVELNRLVETGLAHAPAIAEAEARLRQARAGLSAAHAAQWPGMNASATYVHAHLPIQSLGGGLGGSDLSALGFDAQWELDLWGGQRRSVEKARGTAAAEAARLADSQVALSAEIVRAYVSLRAREAADAVLARQVVLERQSAEAMRQRLAAGTVGRQAAEEAGARLNHAEAEAARGQAETTVWRDTLAVLTGQAPGALDGELAKDRVGGAALEVIPLPPAQVAIGDPGAMLARRPDIRAAEATYAAATAGVGEAQARRYPGISLLGLLGVGGSSIENLVNSGQGAAILMPRLTWDFPDFGRVEARVRGAMMLNWSNSAGGLLLVTSNLSEAAVGYSTTADGRRTRIYDKPATPWQRLQTSGVLDAQQLSAVAARIEGINPADLTRQINAIQMRLLDLAKAKTEALAAARHIDLEALQPSINRLATAK